MEKKQNSGKADRLPSGAFRQQLMRCVEGLYIIEEKSGTVIWVNSYFDEGACVGKPCWKVFMGREARCPSCPVLSAEDGVYSWDICDKITGKWMKIKQTVFKEDGVYYRAGNINVIDDMMRLNYEAVSVAAMLREQHEQDEALQDELEKESSHDKMTGLYNKNRYLLDAEKLFREQPLGVLFFDVNNLKVANDQYGHEAGDALLCRQAEAMKRTAKADPKIRCYRIGGDEYLMLVPDCTEAETERLEAAFAENLRALNEGETLLCQVAVGRAHAASNTDTETLVKTADQRMYENKVKMKKALGQEAR